VIENQRLTAAGGPRLRNPFTLNDLRISSQVAGDQVVTYARYYGFTYLAFCYLLLFYLPYLRLPLFEVDITAQNNSQIRKLCFLPIYEIINVRIVFEELVDGSIAPLDQRKFTIAHHVVIVL